MSYIYKITNQINNKIYIGKTNNSIQKRFNEHCRESKRNTEFHRPLYRAMNKYGIENFKIELIEECDFSIANEREKYWIEFLGSYKNGYNATLGGDGTNYLDYELIYQTYMETKNANKTSKLCNCCPQTVSLVLNNYNISHEERIENAKAIQPKKPVARLDKNTGEILEVFASIKEAERKYPNTHCHIYDVCKGKRKTAGGFGWKYI